MNFRTLKALAVAAPLLVVAGACTDPTVAPKSTVTGANIWNDQNSYQEYMAKLYGGLILTGQQGPAGSADIANIDEGFSEYLRLYWYMQEVPTDEAVIGWNDQGLRDLNIQGWSASNLMVSAMYNRIYFQITLANEFMRQTTAALLTQRNVGPALKATIQNYRAEARFLRALSYWHGMDFFGAIPFANEATAISGPAPKQVSRDSIYNYVVSELISLKDSLPIYGPNTYGRATAAAANMLLAEVYLNAAVYSGTPHYDLALAAAQAVISSPAGYLLEPNFALNFSSDNNTSREIIFSAAEDGNFTQTWGGMTFLVHAGCGGGMKASSFGMDYCWGGYRIKQQAKRLFSAGDVRGAFIYDSAKALSVGDTNNLGVSNVKDSVSDIGDFSKGAAAPKFTNKTSAGVTPAQTTMISTDFPIFRLAEAYLIYAEAAVRTSTNLGTALTNFNLVRARAHGGSAAFNITAPQLTTDTILAERGRELLFEARRRTDLIRYGLFTGGTYNWAWKNNVPGGAAIGAKYNVYPIPSNELSVNPNVTQNTGY
jgi:starch-binding outer membrane protein, SusD/RagB family